MQKKVGFISKTTTMHVSISLPFQDDFDLKLPSCVYRSKLRPDGFFVAECVLINGLTRFKAPIPEEIFFEM